MFVRALSPMALAGLLALPFGSAAAQQFQYAPGTAQYRMTVEAKVTQTAMGQSTETDVSSGQKFTMALSRPSADTLAMSLTVDSVAQMTPMGPVPGLDGLVGKKVQALLSPRGEYYSTYIAPTDTAAALTSVADQLVHVLPRIRVALTNGATWTDTLNATSMQNGIELKRQVISVYTVAGDTTVGGTTARKITRASTSTTSGSGSIQGQAVTMDGTSTGTGVAVVTAGGAFIGSAGSESVKAKLTLTDAGMVYDIDTSAQTKVERVN
ncbi:MAG TPA: hypothetical protein VMV51_15645 [Gemmatimonadaceae bacterium]|nr:hypothetical protein [Gemmatimonadaceae bacterium]